MQLPPALIPRLQQLLRDKTYTHRRLATDGRSFSTVSLDDATASLDSASRSVLGSTSSTGSTDADRPASDPPTVPLRSASLVRVLLTAEQPCPLLEEHCTVIKVWGKCGLYDSSHLPPPPRACAKGPCVQHVHTVTLTPHTS